MNCLGYTPFVNPLPMHHWYLWLLPLCAGLSVVYKSIKCHRMNTVPREAAVVFLTILGGILLAAGVLFALVKVLV
jgi:hypothetical protein